MRQFFTPRALFRSLVGFLLLQFALNLIGVWALKNSIFKPEHHPLLNMTISGSWTDLPPDPRPERVSITYRNFVLAIPTPSVCLSNHPRGLLAFFPASAALMLAQSTGDSDCLVISGLRSRARERGVTANLVSWLGLPANANDFDFYRRVYQSSLEQLSYVGWLHHTIKTGALLMMKIMLIPASDAGGRILEWHGNGLDALVFLGGKMPRLQVFDRAHHRSFEAIFISEGGYWADHDLAAVFRNLKGLSVEEKKTLKDRLLTEGRRAFGYGDYPAATLAYAQFHANFAATVEMEAHRNLLDSLKQLRPRSVEGVLKDLKRRLATDTAAFESLAEGR